MAGRFCMDGVDKVYNKASRMFAGLLVLMTFGTVLVAQTTCPVPAGPPVTCTPTKPPLPKSDTQTSVVLSPTSSTYGAQVVATVTVTADLPILKGTVSCSAGGAQVGSTATISSGTATIAITGLSAGNDVITCTYPGATLFNASSGSATEAVAPGSVTTTVAMTSDTNPVAFGASNVIRVTVTASDASAATGTVTVFDGTSAIGVSTLKNGVGAIVVATLAPGSHTISATYNGDSTHTGSTGNMTTAQVVQSGPPATHMRLFPSRMIVGDSVSAVVSVTKAPGLQPVGSVTCSAPNINSVSQPLDANGQAKLTLSSFPVGTEAVTCSYASSVNSDTSSDTATIVTANAGSTASGNLTETRAYHIASPLPNGDVLIAGGFPSAAGNPIADAETFNLSSNSSTATGSMHVARAQFAVVALPDGEVLTTGGLNASGGIEASSEYYDPTTSTFKSTGSMTSARWLQTATLLPNGTVLVAGGSGSNGPQASAELYTESGTSFSATGSMVQARSGAAAVLLGNGKVFISGGFLNNALASTEIYDPTSGSFSAGPNMQYARQFHTATLLSNGNVLLVGGTSGNNNIPLATAEIYNTSTNTMTTVGSLTTARGNHAATLLGNGLVLISGGATGANYTAPTSSLETFDPSTNTFTQAGNLVTARYSHTATAIGSSSVLIAGGVISSSQYTATTELYAFDIDSGILDLKFLVLGVTYAPPGSGSNVTYGSSSTIGSTTTIDEDTMTGVSVAVTSGIDSTLQIGSIASFGGKNQLTTTGSYSYDTDSSTSYVLQKQTGLSIGTPGPARSSIGVDHDYDLIQIWLDPQLDLTLPALSTPVVDWVGYSYQGCDTTTHPAGSGCDPNNYGQPDIISVPVICLKNPYLQKCQTAYGTQESRLWDLSGKGALTLADYQTILNEDPFIVDPNYNPQGNQDQRFFEEPGVSVQYATPAPGQGPQFYQCSTSTTNTQTNQQVIKRKYGVEITLDNQITAGFAFAYAQDIKTTSTTTWQHETTSAYSSSTTSTAACTVLGPTSADNYTGPSVFDIWHDNIYGTFMFFSSLRPTIPLATLAPSVTPLNFSGSTALGATSAPRTITFQNTSTVSILMEPDITTTGVPAASFSTASFSVPSGGDSCAGLTLAPNATCNIAVQFSPILADLPSPGSTTVAGTMIVNGVELAPGGTNVLIYTPVPLNGTGTR